MTTFLVLLQTNANEFMINEYSGETKTRLYPKYRKDGIAIDIKEWSSENYDYLSGLKFRMENKS